MVERILRQLKQMGRLLEAPRAAAVPYVPVPL
jgi:hypothetical protein